MKAKSYICASPRNILRLNFNLNFTVRRPKVFRQNAVTSQGKVNATLGFRSCVVWAACNLMHGICSIGTVRAGLAEEWEIFLFQLQESVGGLQLVVVQVSERAQKKWFRTHTRLNSLFFVFPLPLKNQQLQQARLFTLQPFGWNFMRVIKFNLHRNTTFKLLFNFSSKSVEKWGSEAPKRNRFGLKSDWNRKIRLPRVSEWANICWIQK